MSLLSTARKMRNPMSEGALEDHTYNPLLDSFVKYIVQYYLAITPRFEQLVSSCNSHTSLPVLAKRYEKLYNELIILDDLDACGCIAWTRPVRKMAHISAMWKCLERVAHLLLKGNGVFTLGKNKFSVQWGKFKVLTQNGWIKTTPQIALSIAFSNNYADVSAFHLPKLQRISRLSQLNALLLTTAKQLKRIAFVQPTFVVRAKTLIDFTNSIPRNARRVYLLRDGIPPLFIDLAQNLYSDSIGVLLGRYLTHHEDTRHYNYYILMDLQYKTLFELSPSEVNFKKFKRLYCEKVAQQIETDHAFSRFCHRVYTYLSNVGITDSPKPLVFVDTGYNATFPLLCMAVITYYNKKYRKKVPAMDVYIMSPYPWLQKALKNRFYSEDVTHIRELESVAQSDLFRFVHFYDTEPVIKLSKPKILKKAVAEMATELYLLRKQKNGKRAFKR